jgi:radical SAM family uncharacterized protein/radical SAM-linked protein
MDANYPLILAGGPCAMNPLPLSPFIDAFCIGDGEDVIVEIIDLYRNFKNENYKRDELLRALSIIDGLYVPAFHPEKPVRRRIVSDLNTAPYPDKPIVPYMQIVHDRVAVEVSRGCTRGCRFCHAGMTYRPVRQRAPETVLALAETALQNTGHDEVSFTSLSIGDYDCLPYVLKEFNQRHCHDRIALSLPSLRIGAVDKEIVRQIKTVRQTGFTIAPEAGTDRLRQVINKDFTEDEYIETLKTLFSEGWQHIKLYFMIGLPTESDEDIEGISDMVKQAIKIGKKLSKNVISINTSISVFVPKPHTPFQWLGQESADILEQRQNVLRRMLKNRYINFKGQHIPTSLLEAVFSRGDLKVASVLERAWRMGCRFDGWYESLDFGKWLKAMETEGVDPYQYAARSYEINNPLPWDMIDSGVSKAFLIREYRRAFDETITPDCKLGCHHCGLSCPSEPTVGAQPTVTNIQEQPGIETKSRQRFRMMFSKLGALKFLSNRETMTAFHRAIRRAGVPILYSEGFHPHPKLSFGPPLPVGIEGLREFFDIETEATATPDELREKLNLTLPDCLKILQIKRISAKEKSLNAFISKYVYHIKASGISGEKVAEFLSLPEYTLERNGKSVDIRKMVEAIDIGQDFLTITLVDMGEVKVRLYETLKAVFGVTEEQVQGFDVKRVRLMGYDEGAGWREAL